MTKNMPLAKFIYPSDPLKKFSGSAHEYCLFIRPFKIFPCCVLLIFLYLNDSFRVRKKWGCNS